MAATHFHLSTIKACTQPKKYNMSFFFQQDVPVLMALCMLHVGLKILELFVYVCTSVVKVFVCPELSVNLPVAVSVYTTEDRVLLGIYIGLSRFHFVSSHVYWLIFTFFARTFLLAKRQLQLVFD